MMLGRTRRFSLRGRLPPFRGLRESSTSRTAARLLKERARRSIGLCGSSRVRDGSTDAAHCQWQLQFFQQSRSFSSIVAAAVDLSIDEHPESFLFEDLEDLHPITKAALQAQGITTMTEIQAKTWKAAITGRDVLGRSRTGSGKTLAFILPSLERILRNHSSNDNKKIQMLIISPTRELANQIFTTSQKLTSGHGKLKHNPPIHCRVFYGGASKHKDIQDMERNMPTILTATPGRLLDHLESSRVHNVPFRDCLKDIQVLVLDEMDRLLDMGFRQDVQSILSHLSSKRAAHTRQTLLFSATIPPGVNQMINTCVRPNRAVVDCIQDDDPSSHTVNTVEQSHVILSADKLVTGVVQTILHLMKSDNQHKILVFFPTTSQVAYFASVFNTALGHRVLEMHGRIAQNKRTITSERFRHSQTPSVMFTSDVSARGVDYPNVTHVLQVGAASDRETYIHRLGRTGRAGKSGQGILLLMKTEAACLRRDLKDLDIPANVKLQNLMDADGTACSASGLDADMMQLQHAIRSGSASKLEGHAISVYGSLFGYYLQRFKSLNVRQPEDAIVEFVNSFANQAGLKELPAIPLRLARQYGLDQHPALNIRREWETGGRNFDVSRTNPGRSGSSSNSSSGRGNGRTGGRIRDGGHSSNDSVSSKPAWAGWLS